MTGSDWANVVVIFLSIIIFGYFMLLSLAYLVLFTAAFFESRRYLKRSRSVDLREIFHSPLAPSISVIIPAYNEEPIIIDSVKAALELQYPRFEVVVVNDGSTDATLARLENEFRLKRVASEVARSVPSMEARGVYISENHDNLVVVDKPNGGKADALNSGINVSRNDITCVVDADSLIEPDALLKIARPFIEEPETTVAAGGVIRIVNGCEVKDGAVTNVGLPRNYWANVQIVEYLRAFLGGRIGWSALHAPLIVSGAFGGFDRRTIVEIGGYRVGAVGEDMEVVVRMHRYLRDAKRKYRMYFVPDPVCWTQAPVHYRQIARQRDRWQRGLIETLMGNQEMLLSPRYGAIGMLAMPFYFFFEMIGPLVELSGYMLVIVALATGQLGVDFLVLFLTVAILFGVLISLIAVYLEGLMFRRYPKLRSLGRLAFYALVENLGYRQLNSWWRTKAYFTYFTRKAKWGEMERSAYGVDTPASSFVTESEVTGPERTA